jgi:S-(hydroxymethyl)glutathione dehydrogenase/alcohol dehydrogenase
VPRQIKFKAAVLEELNKPFSIRELELPHYLGVGQVLVRIKFSGVCGAQLGEQAGVKGPDKFLPHCVGHEGGGIVRALGAGVKHVKLHDHVVVHWRKGVGIDADFPTYWCPELNREVGGGANNTWQQYAVVSENRLTRIPQEIPLDEAALLGCAVTTGLGLVSNEAKVKIGESVIVYGCGGVGLNVIQAASLAGAYPIIGMDIVEEKLQQAIVFGATHTGISGKVEPHLKADVVIDTTGNPEVMKKAWEVAAPSGRVVFVAQLRHDQHLPLQTLPMHQGKAVMGSDGGGTNPTVDIPRYVRLLQSGRLNLRGLITHRTDLEGINDMVARIRRGEIGRSVIEL